MDDNVIETLNKAIKNKETISIVYNGGSQPHTQRPVIPLHFKGENKLLATDLIAIEEKTFDVSKIEIPNDFSNIPVYKRTKTVKNIIIYGSLYDFYTAKVEELKQLGWYVYFDKERENEDNNELLLLYESEKQENVRPKIELSFKQYSGTTEDEMGNLKNVKRKKPYVLFVEEDFYGTGLKSLISYGKYKTIDEVATLFMEKAKELSPNKK